MVRGVWRALVPAMIAAWAAAVVAPPQAEAATAASAGAGWTQETTLDGVGVPAQTLYGRANEVTAWFPPPPGPLAVSGSLARLVFSHSRLLDPASTARVLVNGRELGTVALDAASSDGAVADVPVPAGALETGRPNQLAVRFDVRLAGRPEATADDPGAFVRLESQTALRYQLAVGEGAPPRLDAYPFPLIAVRGSVPTRLGLVMPDPPTAADAGTALRLVADLGRRGRGQQVAPEAVTSGQLDWLRTGGLPALAVGALRRLPAAAPLLRAAGFAPRAAGWTTPDGQDVRPEDGIVAAVVSPWDRRSPVILVTGETDAAVARAAAALTAAAGLPGGGTFALVHPSPGPLPAPEAVGPGGSVTFPELADRALRIEAAGRHVVTLAFTAPAVAPGGTGDLALTLGHTPVPAGRPAALGVLVDGTVVGSISLTQDNERDRSVRLAVPGAALHPGWNTLTLDAGLAGDAAASLRVAPDLRLRLPGAPPERSGLQLLPHPVFDDPGGVHVVLGGAGTTLLTGAARVVAALGERSTSVPRLSVAYQDHATGGAAALVLGVASGSAAAAGVAGALGLAETPAPVPAARSTGVVRLRQTSGGHQVLWVDGGDPAALSLAGDAIARGVLAGLGATVDAAGRVRILAAGGTPAEPAATGVVRALLAIAAGVLVAGVGWLAWRQGSPAGAGGRVALSRRLHAHSVALVAWGAGAAALAIALSPALVAALFTVLVGLVMMATLRTSLRGGLIASGVAAVPFVFAELALGSVGGDAGGLQGFVSSLALEVALLPVSAAVASRVPSGLGALTAAGGEPASAADGPPFDRRPALDGRDRGLQRAAWELARAGEYGREVALALVGPDVPVDGVEVVCRLELMEELDVLLRERVSRFGVVSEHGPCERLVVLPEESACSLSASGARLCREASDRLGCAVRMALASYPVHGRSVPALVSLLEEGLAACRARGIVIQVCGAGHPAGTARDRLA